MCYALRWRAALDSAPACTLVSPKMEFFIKKNLMVHGDTYCLQNLLSFRTLDTLLLNCNVTQIHQCIASSCQSKFTFKQKIQHISIEVNISDQSPALRILVHDDQQQTGILTRQKCGSRPKRGIFQLLYKTMESGGCDFH